MAREVIVRMKCDYSGCNSSLDLPADVQISDSRLVGWRTVIKWNNEQNSYCSDACERMALSENSPLKV